MKSVFIVWKDLQDGMWHPVAKLTRTKKLYRLNYTQGSNHPRFAPFPRMEDRSKVYTSEELFAFFRNRILPQNRPEFKKVLEWSDITVDSYDELDLLSITGGARQTDQFQIIAQPQLTDSKNYSIKFFINGIRYLPEDNIDRISRLTKGDELRFHFEDCNEYDCNAVFATTSDEEQIKVGYCPKYFNSDIRTLMKDPNLKNYVLTVSRVNKDAPAPYRLLCEFVTTWPNGFMPQMSGDYLAHTCQEEIHVQD
ncbi:hypothetical protein V8054_000609 [Vibrio parahaemolyticus]